MKDDKIVHMEQPTIGSTTSFEISSPDYLGTSWDNFLETYGTRLYKFRLATILEAFWHYSQQTEEDKMEAYKIMEVDMEKL